MSACLVYSRGLHGPFLFDDIVSIVNNPQVKKLWPLSEAMTAPPDGPTSNRPLVALSFSLNYAFGGLDVFGYHAVNTALHVANTLLVFTWLLQLLSHAQLPARIRGGALPLSAAMTMLWCLHPLLSESVVYITQRTELMAAFFYLSALVCAVRSLQAPERPVWQWLASAAALLAIGSKETAGTLAVAVVCLDCLGYAPNLRRCPVLYAGLALQLAIAAAICIAAPYAKAGVGFSDGVGPLQWLATQVAVIEMYVRRTLWPDTLSVSYYFPIAQQLLRYWPQLLFVCALFAAALWLAARTQLLAFPALFFFIYLAPSSSVVPMVTEVAAERRMYLPALAIIFYVVLIGHWGLTRLPWSQRGRTLSAALVTLALCAALATRTLARVQDYASSERLWSAAVAADPQDPQARLQLSAALRGAGDFARARALASSLLDWKREFKGAINWSGRAQIALGEIDEADAKPLAALAHYDAVEQEGIVFQAALVNGARVLLRLQRFSEAAQRLQRAIALGHGGMQEHYNLGVALSMLGQYQAASEQFQQAFQLDPSQSASLKALATSLVMQGRMAQAANVLQEVVRNWPDDTVAHDKLERVMAALAKEKH